MFLTEEARGTGKTNQFILKNYYNFEGKRCDAHFVCVRVMFMLGILTSGEGVFNAIYTLNTC